MSNFKVLHSSFACDPSMGSEPYVGWNWAKMLADDYEVHVITRAHHKSSIVKDPLSKKVVFHYFDLFGCENLDHRSKFMKPYYLLWQFFVLFKVFNLHRRLKFSLVHHITYNNLDVPGYLWLLPKVHFVWGPLGGGQVPDKCFKGLYKKGWPKEVAREWLKKFARYNPIVHFAVRKSSLVLFANGDTKKRLNATLMKRSYSMLETAIDLDKVVGLRKSSHKKGTLKVLWVGQVEPRKALRMVVDAIAVGLST